MRRLVRTRGTALGARFWIRAAALSGVASFALDLGCGARDSLPIPPPAPPLPECVVDADCDGFDDLCRNVRCVPDDGTYDGGGGQGGGDLGGQGGTGAVGGEIVTGKVCREVNPVRCDDSDPCTDDVCHPLDGSCSFESTVRDIDGDGFSGPREGYAFDDPLGCGPDCDDTNEDAFPGNPEVCDGADNDCNKIIDDNATFVPIDGDAVRISPEDQTPASPGGISWSGESYVSTFTGTSQGFDIWRSQLAPNGEKLQPDELLKISNSDGMGGPLVWTGDRFGVAWQERRDGDYEVYFRLLDAAGNTVITSPVQLSDAFGFSLNVDLGFTGTRFVAVWQDERSGEFRLYGRLISQDGALDSPEVELVPASSFPDEAPTLAASSAGIGVAWAHGDAGAHFIQFQSFNFDLTPRTETLTLNDGLTEAVYPTIVENDGEWIVSWFDRTASPAGVYAAVVGQDGAIRVAPREVSGTPSGAHARYPALKALGDRVLMVYSDDRDGNDGYELYGRMLSRDLEPITNPARITNSGGDSINPRAAFGPEGNVGILFRDDRLGAQHVFFTRLGCFAGAEAD